MKRSSTQTLHIMYPLNFLCKQYTNQSLSEVCWRGLLPLAPVAIWPSLVAFSSRASGKSSQGRHKQASHHLALVVSDLHLLEPDCEVKLSRRRPRAGLLPPSCVSLAYLF